MYLHKLDVVLELKVSDKLTTGNYQISSTLSTKLLNVIALECVLYCYQSEVR